MINILGKQISKGQCAGFGALQSPVSRHPVMWGSHIIEAGGCQHDGI